MASLDGFSVEQFRLQANHLEHLHSRKRLNPEQRSTNKLIEAISGQFFIHEQVRGFNEILNKRMRIDMIVKPIDSSKWSSTEIAIGIEVKRIDKQYKDTKDFTKHLAQCVDYSYTNWDGFGFVYILSYPSIVPHWATDSSLIHRIAGQLGVGVIEDQNDGFAMLVNEHTIWSQRRGVVEGRTWNLKRKFGSR